MDARLIVISFSCLGLGFYTRFLGLRSVFGAARSEVSSFSSSEQRAQIETAFQRYRQPALLERDRVTKISWFEPTVAPGVWDSRIDMREWRPDAQQPIL